MRRLVIYGVFLAAAVATVVVGIDLLVETDEERIERLLDDMRVAATSGDAERLVSLLDLEGEGFEFVAGRDKERFASGDFDALQERLADGVEWLGGGSLSLESPTIAISGERARVYFRVVLQRQAAPAESFPVEVSLRRAGDSWRATRFRALVGSSSRAARR
jgi:hypothetical protein